MMNGKALKNWGLFLLPAFGSWSYIILRWSIVIKNKAEKDLPSFGSLPYITM